MDFRIAKLRRGLGNGHPGDGFCLMQMVDWFSGSNRTTDHPLCASNVLCKIGIVLNDAPSRRRDTLWPFVWQLLDSYDVDNEMVRHDFILKAVVHRILVPKLESSHGFHDDALALAVATTLNEIQTTLAVVHQRQKPLVQWKEDYPLAVAFLVEDLIQACQGSGYVKVCPVSDPNYAALCMMSAGKLADAVARTLYDDILGESFNKEAWLTLRNIFSEAIALGKHGEIDPVAYEPRAMQLHDVLHKSKEQLANFLV